MQGRRDPLIAAAHMVGWVQRTALELATGGRGHFVATIGIIEAMPGGSNVIPRSARIVIDARSEDRRLMDEFRQRLDAESRSAAKPPTWSARSLPAYPTMSRRRATLACRRY